MPSAEPSDAELEEGADGDETRAIELVPPVPVAPVALGTLATLEPPSTAPAPPPPPTAPPPYLQPSIAPYHPPPSYPPPPVMAAGQPSDGRALVALLAAIGGIVLGLPLGIPGLALGTLAYFLGRSAIERIDASHGAIGGRGMATAAWVMGVIATAIGALSSLAWIVYILVAVSGLPPSG